MKSAKYIFLTIIGSLIMTACDDMDGLNLKRDNPKDGKTSGNNNSEGGAVVRFHSYVIFSGGSNGDGSINHGEAVQMKVLLENTGGLEAKNVSATFSTTSSYISNFLPSSPIGYGDIARNRYNYPYQSAPYIQFTVSNSTPNGTKIPFRINIVDGSGQTWTAKFDVPVK